MDTLSPEYKDLADLWNDVVLLEDLGFEKPADLTAEQFVQRHQKELDEIKALAERAGYAGPYGYLYAVRAGVQDPPDNPGLDLRHWKA